MCKAEWLRWLNVQQEEQADAAPMDMLDAGVPAIPAQVSVHPHPLLLHQSVIVPDFVLGYARYGASLNLTAILANTILDVSRQVLTSFSCHVQVQGAEPMDIDGGQAAGGSWLHDGAAGQDMGGSSQLSPEDAELLALAAAPLSQPEADVGAAHETAANPPQELSQISPEDEELLALASQPRSQAECLPAQHAAPQQSEGPSQMSSEDEELLALASQPPSQAERLPAQHTAPQQSEGPSQISPEDEELLALVALQPSQQQEVHVAAGAGPALTLQVSSLLDPEDEEVLALAAALPTQLETACMAQPAGEGEGARPEKASCQLSPEDEELLALASAPPSQLHPAATAPETELELPQGNTGTGSPVMITGELKVLAESLASPTQVSSLESPVGGSEAQQDCAAVQLHAGALDALQPQTASAHESMSADDEELMSLAGMLLEPL
jgi:hypothetical protein